MLKVVEKLEFNLQNANFFYFCLKKPSKNSSTTIQNFILFILKFLSTDKLAVQKDTYNAICADMDTTFAEMAGF
jgi:hypothetical protein